jgi:hypothetical protein
MSISNRIISGIFILSVFESESEHKYENKYDISDIRPYPIRFHPYLFPMGSTIAAIDFVTPGFKEKTRYILYVK